jgi:CubicO group peptidase (beta-lactamase class C family)
MKILYRAILILLVSAIPVALNSAQPEGAVKSVPEIDAALKPFVEKHAIAGAVTLVADKDKVLSVNAIGYLDLSAKVQMAFDTIFWIASMTKPITAAALMMLVDEGKVALDDPVEKYLPEFEQVMVKGPDKTLVKPMTKITVRQLLTHTSGMPFRWEKELLDLPLKEAALNFAQTPLEAEPGTKHQYSNAGFNTAGRIIEVASGMPYEEFLDKRLFIPLGMKDTTFWPSESQLKRLAKSYRATKDKTNLEEMTIERLRYPLSDRKRQPMPSGGLFSTARDMGRFCQMMLNYGEFEGKRYLSESAVKQMQIRQIGDKVKSWRMDETVKAWGLGTMLFDNGYGHGGGMGTLMSIDPNAGIITVFMVQHPGNVSPIREEFQKAAGEALKTSRK